MVRVLYIVGWGRSGSTLLDMALGSLDGFVSTGELHYLWERGVVRGDHCGCGRVLRGCPFWRQVLDRVGSRAGWAEEFGAEARRVVELQKEADRIRRTTAIPSSGSSAVRELQRISESLVAAVADVSGADVVIDSSKRPSTAALYLRIPGVELHVVHLVRDPRAVAHSWQRRKMRYDVPQPYEMLPHSPLASSAHWVSWNLLAEWLGPRAHSYQRVRYEDFVAHPAAVLRGIADGVGQDVDVGRVVSDQGLLLGTTHTVSGNPNRLARGPVPIHVDDDWIREQRLRDRLVAVAPASPLIRRYGYPWRSAASPTTSA